MNSRRKKVLLMSNELINTNAVETIDSREVAKMIDMKIIINSRHLTVAKGKYSFMLYDRLHRHLGLCIGRIGSFFS